MALLSEIKRPGMKPVQGTLLGEAGVGKTTLAALFPNPIFIRCEDGLGSIDVDAFPVVRRGDEVKEQMAALYNEEHDYKTLIIDSVSKLNIIFEHEIVRADNAKSINTALGGYGAGFGALAEKHRVIKSCADDLTRDKGMNIIFISHADTETIDPPDADSYTRFTTRLHKKSQSHYVDDVDFVGMIKLQSFIKGHKSASGKEPGKAGKAIGDGSRVLVCYPTPSNVSKNRFGISENLIIEPGINPLLPFIPVLSEQLKQVNTKTKEA